MSQIPSDERFKDKGWSAIAELASAQRDICQWPWRKGHWNHYCRGGLDKRYSALAGEKKAWMSVHSKEWENKK